MGPVALRETVGRVLLTGCPPPARRHPLATLHPQLVTLLMWLGIVCGCGGDTADPRGPDAPRGEQAQAPTSDNTPAEVWAKRDRRPPGGENGAHINGEWTQYSVGGTHSCGVRADGTASCWGVDRFGQKQVPEGRFVQLAAGGEHSCGRLDDGRIQCWGSDHAGATTPPAGHFTDVQAGWGFNCALDTSGAVTCWGFDGAGQASPPDGAFSQISVGYHHACGLHTDGSLACWGRDDFGQSQVPEGRFVQVSAGEVHSCALSSDGALRCWGDHHHQATDVNPGIYSQVSAGYWHTCALTTAGEAACWGHDAVFQASPASGAYTSLRAGFYHSCGQRPDGSLNCWGWNYNLDHLLAKVEGGGKELQGDELFSDQLQSHICPYESLGLMYFLQDRQTEAKEHLSKALEAQAYWEYGKHVAMAEILIEEGELQRAEDLLLRAQEKFGPQAAEDPSGADRVPKLIERVRELQGLEAQ